MLEINGTALALAFSFIIFTIIMNRIMFAPFSKVRRKRHIYIKSNVIDSEANKQNAQDTIKNYEKELKTARINANKKVHGIQAQANKERDLIINQATQELISAKKQNLDELEQEKKHIHEELKNQVMYLAQDISKSILKEEIPICVPPSVIDEQLKD